MAKNHDRTHESESPTDRQLDHNRRNEMQSELIRQELERIRRAAQSAAAIRRGMRSRAKTGT